MHTCQGLFAAAKLQPKRRTCPVLGHARRPGDGEGWMLSPCPGSRGPPRAAGSRRAASTSPRASAEAPPARRRVEQVRDTRYVRPMCTAYIHVTAPFSPVGLDSGTRSASGAHERYLRCIEAYLALQVAVLQAAHHIQALSRDAVQHLTIHDDRALDVRNILRSSGRLLGSRGNRLRADDASLARGPVGVKGACKQQLRARIKLRSPARNSTYAGGVVTHSATARRSTAEHRVLKPGQSALRRLPQLARQLSHQFKPNYVNATLPPTKRLPNKTSPRKRCWPGSIRWRRVRPAYPCAASPAGPEPF